MRSVEIVILVQFPICNESFSISVSREVGSIGYIIRIIYSNTTIDYVYSKTPDFDVPIILPWSMP